MTYEEYRKKKKANEPRSIPLTIFFAGMSVISIAGCALICITISQTGFNLANVFLLILLAMFAIYAGLCAADGRAKSTKEALFDIAWLFPF